MSEVTFTRNGPYLEIYNEIGQKIVLTSGSDLNYLECNITKLLSWFDIEALPSKRPDDDVLEQARATLENLRGTQFEVNGLVLEILEGSLESFTTKVIEDKNYAPYTGETITWTLENQSPPMWSGRMSDESLMELTFIRQYGIDMDWSLEFFD